MPPEVPQAQRGNSPEDGDDHPMREEGEPAGLCGGDRVHNVVPFPEVFKGMKVNNDPGLFPMVEPTFPPPLSSNRFAGLPPPGTPLAEVQLLQENLDKLCKLLKKC